MQEEDQIYPNNELEDRLKEREEYNQKLSEAMSECKNCTLEELIEKTEKESNQERKKILTSLKDGKIYTDYLGMVRKNYVLHAEFSLKDLTQAFMEEKDSSVKEKMEIFLKTAWQKINDIKAEYQPIITKTSQTDKMLVLLKKTKELKIFFEKFKKEVLFPM